VELVLVESVLFRTCSHKEKGSNRTQTGEQATNSCRNHGPMIYATDNLIRSNRTQTEGTIQNFWGKIIYKTKLLGKNNLPIVGPAPGPAIAWAKAARTISPLTFFFLVFNFYFCLGEGRANNLPLKSPKVSAPDYLLYKSLYIGRFFFLVFNFYLRDCCLR